MPTADSTACSTAASLQTWNCLVALLHSMANYKFFK